MRALAKSGFNGDETAGTCCSSSSPKGRLGATEEGVELRGRGDADIFSALDILQRAGASVNFRKLDLLALALYVQWQDENLVLNFSLLGHRSKKNATRLYEGFLAWCQNAHNNLQNKLRFHRQSLAWWPPRVLSRAEDDDVSH